MDNLIKELFWGNLQFDTMQLKSDKQMRMEAKKKLELSEKFGSLLSEAAAEAYEELSSYENETDGDLEALRFVSGFKTGALFMMEIFT